MQQARKNLTGRIVGQAINEAPTGTDGPYPAPLVVGPWTVQPEWIDYNGHMNVAYYTMAFDQAVDRVSEDYLGIGETFTNASRLGPYVLQMQTHFLSEMHRDEAFTFRFHLLDCDEKRLHACQHMIAEDGREAAFIEAIFLNVDLNTRRAAPYPEWAQARLQRMRDDHAHLPRPAQLSAPIGIRRR